MPVFGIPSVGLIAGRIQSKRGSGTISCDLKARVLADWQSVSRARLPVCEKMRLNGFVVRKAFWIHAKFSAEPAGAIRPDQSENNMEFLIVICLLPTYKLFSVTGTTKTF